MDSKTSPETNFHPTDEQPAALPAQSKRAPYSPRTFRQPGESQEEWRRRQNRAKKARYRERHPERVRAEKRHQYHKHRDEILRRRKQKYEVAIPCVAQEELDFLRAHFRQAIRDDEIVCLECGARVQRLATHLFTYHHMRQGPYKERWGYDRTTALCAKSESLKVSKEAKRRHWQQRLRPFRFRLGHSKGGVSRRQEAKLTIADHLRGGERPTTWKRMPDGRVVSDALLAQARLKGERVEDIARLVGLDSGVVSVRLRKIGFEGRDIAFDRGAVVTGVHLVNLCKDFHKTRLEVSTSLGKRYNWAGDRTRPIKLHEPLSRNMALRVLELRDSLRQQYRTTGAIPKIGGRPRVLLPSERAELPGKYRALLADLRLLSGFVKEKGRTAKMDAVWEWACNHRRQGHIRTLFYWAPFYNWIEEDVLLGGAWLPSDAAIDFLAAEYGTAHDTIRLIVRGVHASDSQPKK
jgi:hypothetical protein